jgi:uncharacterized protein YcfJ
MSINRKFLALGVASLIALGSAGCANQQGGGINKETAGTVLGGIGGAVIGAQFGGGVGQLVTTAAGALGGAYLGNQAGKSLDRSDQL